jgi:4-amino-4-deoxy-L-arabinose transferase-like glycosyltransferase
MKINKGTLLDVLGLVFFYFILHERLLDYFDYEGFYISQGGWNLLKHGILATPEYQFYSDTAPFSPYYISYFFAGLSLLIFGFTSLGAIAHIKLATLITILSTYVIIRITLKDRLLSWCGASFLLLFPFYKDFIITRADPIGVCFGWIGITLLVFSLEKELSILSSKTSETAEPYDTIDLKKIVYRALGAGICVAFSFFSHPLGLQFYMGASLLALACYFGPFKWVLRKTTRWFFAGFLSIALIFSLFVINWEKYLYFANQFQSYATRFWPPTNVITNFIPEFKKAMDPFFFTTNIPNHFVDIWYLSPILAAIILGSFIGIIWEFFGKTHSTKSAIFFRWVFIWNLFLFTFAVPRYRAYVVHMMPLMGILLAIGLNSLRARISLNSASRLESTSKVFLFILVFLLCFPSAKNILDGKTLFSAPSRYTLIQDAVADIKSVIPPGARVVTSQGEMILFPDNIVRTHYVFQRYKQLPVPEYIQQEQLDDGITDPNFNWDEPTRDRFAVNTRYHFHRFLPNYFVTDSYQNLNCSFPVAEFNYEEVENITKNHYQKKLIVYKVNYNEWPFKQIPNGARLYPSFSDPISATRYRQFLLKGLSNEIVVPDRTLSADAGSDSVFFMPPEDNFADVPLNGSGSKSTQNEIVHFRWEIDRPLKGDASKVVSTDSYPIIAEGKITQAKLPAGKHIIHLVTTDSEGHCSRDVKVAEIKVGDPDHLINYAHQANGGKANGFLEHSGLSPNNAIDGVTTGDLSKSWTAEPDLKSWWQVDLGGKPRSINFIYVYFLSNYFADASTNNFEIWGSNDVEFKSYDVIAERGDEKYPRLRYWKKEIQTDKRYRFLRLIKTKPTYTSFVEIEVFGEKEG